MATQTRSVLQAKLNVLWQRFTLNNIFRPLYMNECLEYCCCVERQNELLDDGEVFLYYSCTAGVVKQTTALFHIAVTF